MVVKFRNMFLYKTGKLFIAAAALMYAGNTAMAQEPETERELDRRVDVSREYLPDMDRAPKLTIAPVMNDTVALRPDLEYTVSPSPWVTGFGVAAINPVRVDAATFELLNPFYLKAGIGFPTRSILDFYGTTVGTSGGYAGGYLNHAGNWSKLKNGYGSKERALESRNKLGLFGRTYLGRRIALSGEVGYDYDIYSHYGFPTGIYPVSPLSSYSVPRVAVEIGNDFSDMSFFNFAVGAEGYLLQGRADAKESGIKAKLAFGKAFGVHYLKLGALYDGAYGGGQRDGMDINTLSVTPSYMIEGGLIRIGAQVEIAYSKDKAADRSKTFFLPSADIAINVAEAFTPYAKLDSRLISNSYHSVIRRNPYVYSNGFSAIPTRDYKALAGFRGDVSSVFSYELRIGGGYIKDYLYHVLDEDTGYFLGYLPGGKINYFTAGGSLSGRISNSFTVGLDVDYYNYSDKTADSGFGPQYKYASGLPEFSGCLNLSYNHREKVFIKVRGELTGNRDFAGRSYYSGSTPGEPYIYHYTKVSGVFDLGVDAEYRLNNNLGLFLTADNLLNRKLYPYYGYQGFGVGVSAGVKLLF